MNPFRTNICSTTHEASTVMSRSNDRTTRAQSKTCTTQRKTHSSSIFYPFGVSWPSCDPKPASDRSGLMRAQSFDTSDITSGLENYSEIRQTMSDGFDPSEKRAVDVRQKKSQTRAAQLSASYERNENRDHRLNPRVIIPEPVRFAPSLSQHAMPVGHAANLSIKQANKEGIPPSMFTKGRVYTRNTLKEMDSGNDENQVPNAVHNNVGLGGNSARGKGIVNLGAKRSARQTIVNCGPLQRHRQAANKLPEFC